MAALLAISVIAAPVPHEIASAQPQQLYFFAHIAKCGGTSFATDMAKIDQTPLRHCGSSHVAGPSSVKQLQQNLALASDAAEDCNLLNREDQLSKSLQTFSSLGLPSPRLILMLRHPVTHVRSMYSHCQVGWLRREREREGTFQAISFSDWLALFQPNNFSRLGWDHGAWRYCYYNPRNYQAALLAPDRLLAPARENWNSDAARELSPEAVSSVLGLITQAWHVGITGYYSTSLCLLSWRLKGTLSDACAARSVETTHADYGNHAQSTPISGSELNALLEITQADHIAYGAALQRLFADARQAGLGVIGYRDA